MTRFVAFFGILFEVIIGTGITPPNCDGNVVGNDWFLVRRTTLNWHISNDNLMGTDLYGFHTDNDYLDSINNQSFSKPFQAVLPNFDSFLFASGDCTKWGIISKNDVNKNIRETGAYNIELLRSNSNPCNSKIIINGGIGSNNIDDHYPIFCELQCEFSTKTWDLYAENNYFDNDNSIPNVNGMNVWISRNIELPNCVNTPSISPTMEPTINEQNTSNIGSNLPTVTPTLSINIFNKNASPITAGKFKLVFIIGLSTIVLIFIILWGYIMYILGKKYSNGKRRSFDSDIVSIKIPKLHSPSQQPNSRQVFMVSNSIKNQDMSQIIAISKDIDTITNITEVNGEAIKSDKSSHKSSNKSSSDNNQENLEYKRETYDTDGEFTTEYESDIERMFDKVSPSKKTRGHGIGNNNPIIYDHNNISHQRNLTADMPSLPPSFIKTLNINKKSISQHKGSISNLRNSVNNNHNKSFVKRDLQDNGELSVAYPSVRSGGSSISMSTQLKHEGTSGGIQFKNYVSSTLKHDVILEYNENECESDYNDDNLSNNNRSNTII